MVPNVTIAQASVLSALDYSAPRDTIVMTELDFPSVRYVYDAARDAARRADRRRAERRRHRRSTTSGCSRRSTSGRGSSRSRTCSFDRRSSWTPTPICTRAHDVGALVSLDAFHSVGVMPVDVTALGVDFLTGGVLKWLCGGPGGCFLYVAPEVERDARRRVHGMAGARASRSRSRRRWTTPTTRGAGWAARR